MFQLLHFLIQLIQPMLVPLCFVSAWGLVLLVILNSWSLVQDTAKRSHRMHQIPCANCQFFTNDRLLKCTVHPSSALTEEAIDCSDYVSTDPVCQVNRN